VEALRARRATVAAKALDRQRSQRVELVSADWKPHRKRRHWSGLGLRRARGQVGRVVLAHNLRTLRSEEQWAKATRAADENPVANVA
jgi:hypothetical protein